MRTPRVLIPMLALLLAAGTVALVNGCYGLPKGTVAQVEVGGVRITATGAGIVKADAKKTTFQIKCEECGFQTEQITIDTPTPGHPYSLKWVCPTCGHKQTIVISAI